MKTSTKYLKIFCNLALVLAIILFVIFLLPRILVFFMPFVVGFVLSLIANPLVRFLEKRIKIKRKYGSVLIIVGAIAIVVLVCYGLGTAVTAGVRGFIEYLPTMYENGKVELMAAMDSVEHMLGAVSFLPNINIRELGRSMKELLGTLITGEDAATVTVISGFAKSIPNVLVSSVMGLLATYFFIADRDKMADILAKTLPKSFQEKTLQMYKEILKAVGGYFKAQFKIMGVIYIIIAIGLRILGVDFAWLIGFGIAFLDMLPVFGTGTVLTPWAIIKFLSGNYMTAIGMLILYVVALLAHQIIQPKLIGDSVGMNTFLTLFFMYIGYQVSGVFGMIVAIPLGMLGISLYKAGAFDTLIWCIKEIAKDFYGFCKLK